MIKLAVSGACGRMGREIIKVIEADAELMLSSAVEHEGNPLLGDEIALGVKVSADIISALRGADVLIDFSGAAGTMSRLDAYRSEGRPLIIGSTGFTETERSEVLALADTLPLFISSNMSVGVSVAARLVSIAAGALDNSFDIEVFEAHHRHKKDAPSGTALTLAVAAAKGRGLSLSSSAVYSREGVTAVRSSEEIGFQVLRGGDIVGEHTVFFCGEGERVEITHRATSRSIFAQGAIKAAKWLHQKTNGLYGMNDLLGLKSE